MFFKALFVLSLLLLPDSGFLLCLALAHDFLGGGFLSQLLEAVDTSGGIEGFFLAGIERVAGGTDLYPHLFGDGPGFDDVAASADYFCISMIFWVYLLLHIRMIRVKMMVVNYLRSLAWQKGIDKGHGDWYTV